MTRLPRQRVGGHPIACAAEAVDVAGRSAPGTPWDGRAVALGTAFPPPSGKCGYDPPGMPLSNAAATRCDLCQRSLLIGEIFSRFRDDRVDEERTVCPLCSQRAERLGWHLVPNSSSTRLPFRPDRKRSPQRLAERTHQRLDETARRRSALEGTDADEPEPTSDVDGPTDLAPSPEDRIRDLERQLAEARRAQEWLIRARVRESDLAYLQRIALEVLYRSSHAERINELADREGPPEVSAHLVGVELPRPVRIDLGWPSVSLSYVVTCDLVVRSFDIVSVTETPLLGPGQVRRLRSVPGAD